ncbi:MAG: SCO family protein [Thermoleophilia bacterium]
MLVASLAAAVAALGIVLLGVSSGGGGGDAYNASAINPSRPAPATTGTAYDGTPVDAPTPGRPAVVTFLFANCPDVCPTIAAVLATSLDDLGADADELDVIAVSVDPEGDTPEAVGGFLDRFNLDGRMQYITGTRAELTPLWKEWFVLAQEEGADASTHSARVVLIDRDGRQVASYAAGVPVPVADMTEDLRTLIAS